jgi:hypothetical protein
MMPGKPFDHYELETNYRRFEDCWGKQSHCQTITDDTYRPILAFDERVWHDLLTDVLPCSIQLVVDPAIQLTPIIEDGQALHTLKPLPKHTRLASTTMALADTDPGSDRSGPPNRVIDQSRGEAVPGGRILAPGPAATGGATAVNGIGNQQDTHGLQPGEQSNGRYGSGRAGGSETTDQGRGGNGESPLNTNNKVYTGGGAKHGSHLDPWYFRVIVALTASGVSWLVIGWDDLI